MDAQGEAAQDRAGSESASVYVEEGVGKTTVFSNTLLNYNRKTSTTVFPLLKANNEP